MAHGTIDLKDLIFGVTAEFSDPDHLLEAAKKARAEGFTEMDCYTPFPVHGLDEAIGFREAKVQWSIGLMGFCGLLVGIGMQVYTSAVDYPLNIGGRPLISWPAFFPVAYECTILLAGLTALVSMLGFNGLPRPNHPIFNAENFEQASQGKFFLCVEAKDPNFSLDRTTAFLKTLGADNVAVVMADEPEAKK